ncbi:stress-activated map kinase interacting protein 1-domain-containing protein [Mycena alexandri]|nr:stress-activated map kinase interacting protein 1-domain-containing protein [Mycena alexandri]
MTFARKKVAPLPARPQRSALTALIVSSGESTNLFAELYAAVSGSGEGASTNVTVYFPSARAPKGQAMDLNVRKDAMVEEVIGFALWTYCEEGWLPKLDEGMENAGDKAFCCWVDYAHREEDGEVDDDFPPPDRIGKVAQVQCRSVRCIGSYSCANPTKPTDRNQDPTASLPGHSSPCVSSCRSVTSANADASSPPTRPHPATPCPAPA